MSTSINGTTGIDVSAVSSSAITADRTSTDGTIIDLQKDGSSVGSIGSRSNVVSYIVLDPRTSVKGAALIGGSNGTTTGIINPGKNDGDIADAAIDLGSTYARFKDLYLSGGVYLGGTGSSNLLQDYEIGSWTPQFQGSVTNPTVSYSSTVGEYVKIGKLVHVSGRIYVTSSSGLSGNLLIGNLPFTVVCTSSTENSPITVGAAFGSGWTTTNRAPQGGFVNHNQTRATLIGFDSSDPRDGADTRLTILPANAGMIFSITYYTS